MTAGNRFIPSICSAVVLLGSVVPFKGNLVSLPAQYRITETGVNGPMGSVFKEMFKGLDAARPGLATAETLAFLVYVVPLVAFTLIVLNLRGFVSKRVQIAAAAAIFVCGIVVPLITNSIALHAIEKISMMGMSLNAKGANIFALNLGDWLIALGALALLLSGFGVLAFVPTGTPDGAANTDRTAP